MNRIALALAAGLLGLGLTAGTAAAHGPYPGPAYHVNGAVRFSGGYYYAGHDHHHWSRRVWDAGCHRYHYYDPGLHCWYYWHAGHHCYYPVTYCP
jgi:hypothetical protein